MQPYRPEDYPSGLSIFKSALFIVFFTGADNFGVEARGIGAAMAQVIADLLEGASAFKQMPRTCVAQGVR